MHAPFNLAFNTTAAYFEWLEQPGNEARLKRFGPAMTGTAAWEVPGAIVSGQFRFMLTCPSADIVTFMQDSPGRSWTREPLSLTWVEGSALHRCC